MWSRITHMSCISSKAPNQALKGDPEATDIDLPSRRQTSTPSLSAIDRAVSMRILEREAERTEVVLKTSANSSPETSLREMHASIRPKGLKLDTSGLPVKNPDTFSYTKVGVGVGLPHIFEDATTLASDHARTKLTGTGAPGSHSALFGLTPDGHKEDEADYSSPKLPRAKLVGNTSAPNVDGPEDAKISNYQHTVSHSALFGLMPAKPKESEANQSSSKTELVQDIPSSSSDRPGADAGTSRHPQTISHSALFGLMPEGVNENQANKWLSNSEPARGAEELKVSRGSPGAVGPVAPSSDRVGVSAMMVTSRDIGDDGADADTSGRDVSEWLAANMSIGRG